MKNKQETERGVPFLFVAVCEMCVFRYKQHSSRDKTLGPSTPTLPRLSTHHAYSSVCVCVCLGVRVCVYVGRGTACPVPQNSQGATEKTAVCLRDTENVRKREWRANRHASQDRHFWSEYHLLSPSPLHLPPPPSSNFIPFPVSLLPFKSSLCTCTLLYHSYYRVVFAMFSSSTTSVVAFLRCNAPANAPCPYVRKRWAHF